MALQMSWDEILKGIATTYVLRGLTVLTAWLAAKGLGAGDWFSAENLAYLAGVIVVGGIDVAVTLYRKKLNHNVIEAARITEKGTSFADIKDVAASLPILGTGDGK